MIPDPGDPRPGLEPAQRSDLEAERDYLLRSLADLEREHREGEIGEGDFAVLRDSYTARAARVLRRLGPEDHADASDDPPAPPAAEPGVAGSGPAGSDQAGSDQAGSGPAGGSGVAEDGPPLGLRARLRRRRGPVVGAGLALVVLGVGLLAYGSSGSRQAGQTVSGSVPLAPAQELSAAQHAMATGDDVTALKLFQAVLHVEPNQPEALAYSGWLLREAGDAQANTGLVAQGMLAEESAVRADARYPDARFFLGVMLLDEAHDAAGAVAELEAYLALHPSAQDVKDVQPVLARARAEAAAGASTSTTTP